MASKKKKKKNNLSDAMITAALLGRMNVGTASAAAIPKGIITHPMINYKVNLIQ